MTLIDSLGGLATFINAHAVWPNLPIWAYVVFTLIDTHITTTCVTLYLHRCQTHRSISFAPPVEHFMRFWLWVRTAMPTREWVAVHRCHHAYVETEKDPHSPIQYGIWRVVFFGTGLYHRAAHNKDIIEQYGKGTPDDALEVLYDRFSLFGPVLTLITNLWLFGIAGLPMWLVEMAWIPFFAAGVINGLGHWWGYRNFETPDASTNLPGTYWSLLTAGEALHNNHHHIQNAARFSMKKGEFDPGYLYFSILKVVGLAKARRETVSV
jgi:stearoyl-CoA desaturase (delta-9 desaturase)